jgi:hypothetical protein
MSTLAGIELLNVSDVTRRDRRNARNFGSFTGPLKAETKATSDILLIKADNSL